MDRKIWTALVLALTAFAAAPDSARAAFCVEGLPCAVYGEPPEALRAPPPAWVALILSNLDRDCEDPQAAACFPSRFAAALVAAPESAPAAEVLAAAAEGLRFARLEADLGTSRPPAFREPQTKKFALLVGVSGYSAQSFARTAANLDLMERALKDVGFETSRLLDPTAENFAREQNAWRKDLADAPQDAQALAYPYGLGLTWRDEQRFCLQTPSPAQAPDFWRDCLPLSNFSAHNIAPSILIVDAEFMPPPTSPPSPTAR